MLCHAQLALNEINSAQELAELHKWTSEPTLLKS